MRNDNDKSKYFKDLRNITLPYDLRVNKQNLLDLLKFWRGRLLSSAPSPRGCRGRLRHSTRVHGAGGVWHLVRRFLESWEINSGVKAQSFLKEPFEHAVLPRGE